jgi:hypothetical protein
MAILPDRARDIVFCALCNGMEMRRDSSSPSTRLLRRTCSGVARFEAARSAAVGTGRGESRDRFVFTPPDIIELTKFPELFLGILFE